MTTKAARWKVVHVSSESGEFVGRDHPLAVRRHVGTRREVGKRKAVYVSSKSGRFVSEDHPMAIRREVITKRGT